MTKTTLEQRTLTSLKACRAIALDNQRFYERLYDGMEEALERDKIGRALAQKHSFVGAIDAILKNHDIVVPEAHNAPPSDGNSDILDTVEPGEHLAQEERFHDALKACIAASNDALTTELLEHHLRASEVAVTEIKSTSLKI